MEKRPRSCRSTAKKVSFSLFFILLSFSVSLIVGHAVARRHEHRRISFCARGIIMAEEEAKPSALAHVGRTLNDELDTARVREKKRDRKRKRERRRERVCTSESRGEKRKRKEDVSLQPHERLPISISPFSSSTKQMTSISLSIPLDYPS